jgi:mannose-1-phosphate guanylyltransferase
VLNEGCTLDGSLIFNYTQIAAGVTLRHQMVMGRYCISSDGNAIDTEESNLTWLIGDARSNANGKIPIAPSTSTGSSLPLARVI